MSQERIAFILSYPFAPYYDNESAWNAAFEGFKAALKRYDESKRVTFV